MEKIIVRKRSIIGSEEKIKRFGKEAGVFLWCYLHESDVLEVDENLFDYMGYDTLDDLANYAFIDPEEPENLRKIMKSSQDRVPFVGGVRLKMNDKDRDSVELMYIGSTCSLKDGRITTGTLVDVEHKMRIEARLKHVDKLMLVGQMFGGVAHDIKNQIMTIDAAVTMIDKVSNDQRVYKYLHSIEEAVENSTFLLQHLTKFTGNNRHDLKRINTNELVGRTITILRQTVKGNFVINANYQAQHDMIYGEEHLLENVLLNIALNARDAMPSGGTIEFTTYNKETNPKSCQEHFGWIYLSIKDNGVGMDEKTRKRIFEPYFSTKPVGSGAGMGLALCLSTLHSHDATIEVFSEPGKGAEFILAFPLNAQGGQEMEPQPKPTKDKVLILETVPSVRLILRSVLKDMGHKVKAFSTQESLLDYMDAYDGIIKAVFVNDDLTDANALQSIRDITENHGVKVVPIGEDCDIKRQSILECSDDREKILGTVASLLE